MPTQEKPPRLNKNTIRLQIFLSAFVLPGAGQFLQKRWVPGVAHSIIFLCCFVYIILEVALPSIQNLRIALDVHSVEPFAQINMKGIMICLLIALTAYLLNLLDVYKAARK